MGFGRRRDGARRTSAWGLCVVMLLALGCGDATTRAGHGAEARKVVSVSTHEPVARLSGAVLTEADLGDTIASQPARAKPARAPAVPAAEEPSPAPLPPEVARALVPGRLAAGDSGDLAISFEDGEGDLLRSALGGASVLDDPLPPAAPDPDLDSY